MRITLTARDYDTALAELKAKATALFPSWTKFIDSNIGTVILKLFAMFTDQGSLLLNRVFNQCFLATVDVRRYAQHICNKLNYTIAGPATASVDLTFAFEGGGTHTENVTIPAGTRVETTDGSFHFETLTDLTITAGNPNGTVSAKNWTAQSETFTADGSSGQEVFLRYSDFIAGSADVTIAAVGWTEQDDLLESGAADKHYKIEYDNLLRAILVFGDGTNGAMPSGSGTVTYNTGGGSAANGVAIGTITKILDTIYDALSAEMSMTCTNAAAPAGGDDSESIDVARVQAPASYRAQDRTISRDDYEANAEEVSGVARCLALGHQQESGIALGMEYLWIVPVGGGAPSAALKTAVETYLKNDKPIVDCSDILVNDGEYVTITIVAAVTAKSGFLAADVKTAIDAAFNSAVDPYGYFDYRHVDDAGNYTMEFGYNKGYFYVSEVYDIIMGTEISGEPCVENVTITTINGVAPANIAIGSHKIPEIGSLAGITVS